MGRSGEGGVGEESRLCAPLPSLPAPRRIWQGMQPPMPKTCTECGGALSAKQRKFCSDGCLVSFRVAATTTVTALTVLPTRGRARASAGAY
jgi:hypothetical protein